VVAVDGKAYTLQYDLKKSPKVEVLTEQAIARLRKHEPEDGYYLAFSGGKDSMVIYDLAVCNSFESTILMSRGRNRSAQCFR
jgi:3'-phosphoadenosine 5'-phosphosulfate sulfotransferase (PAPS reductase)/FAD synthetase